MAVEDGMEFIPEGGGRGAEGAGTVGVEAVLAGGGAEVMMGGEVSALGAEAEEGEGGAVGEDGEVGGGLVEVAADEFRGCEGEVGVEAGGGGWGGWKGAEAAAPEVRHCGTEGAGVGALMIARESAEDARRELEAMPQGGRAQEREAVAHGEFGGGGSRPVEVGTADGEDAARESGGGGEVEAAVESGEGHSGLEVEGGKAQLEMEAGNCGEGDTEGSGEGFVELDL